MRVTSFETPQGQFVSWLMGKVFHVQSIFEENCDIDEVGCIDVVRSGGTWLCDGCDGESCCGSGRASLRRCVHRRRGPILGSPELCPRIEDEVMEIWLYR